MLVRADKSAVIGIKLRRSNKRKRQATGVWDTHIVGDGQDIV